MQNLFDAHCHVTRNMAARLFPSPAGAGNRRLVCGVSPSDDWPVVADWARAWTGTVPAFGVHPWEAASVPDDWERDLENSLLRFPDAWVGEIGLDGARTNRAPLDRQTDVLRRQLRLAVRLKRRVNLHCVKAYDALLALLDEEYFPSGRAGFILHSFNGPHQMVGEFADRGAYFSVGPLASRHDTRKIRARAALLPPDRIVLESDAFLEPGLDAKEDLLFTLHWLADVKETPVPEMTNTITANSQRILDA